MARARGLVGLTACLIACGPRYHQLEVDKIQSVAVTADDLRVEFCAYEPVALRALVTYRDGKQVQSHARGESDRGRVRVSEFAWSSSLGAVDAEAVLSLPAAVLGWFDQPIQVAARVIARPALAGEATLSPRFDCGGTIDVRGEPGARGGEAEDGGPGERGPDVEVALGYIDSQRRGRLVLVRVTRGTDAPEHYLVDARDSRSRLVIDARGGAGGKGGQGVAGADGAAPPPVEAGQPPDECADGPIGEPAIAGEPGRSGGPGASGGTGGNGGTVSVRYDARFAELPTRVEIRVDGGEAGEAGQGGPAGRGGAADPRCGAATAGPDGEPGPDGHAGVAGGPGEVRASAVDVSELFADELASGLPIVGGAP